MDWFSQTNVILVPASRMIIIPSQKIFCLNDDESDNDTINNNDREFNDDIFDVLISQAVDDCDFEEALEIKQKKYQ